MNKRKTAALVAALSLSASIALSGTLAWRSISQEAKNEIVRTLNPGARLHDDFDGRNKDVYVENFFTLAEGGQPIFARVRLDEYMEVGRESGMNLTDSAGNPRPVGSRNVTVLARSAKDPTKDADINDVTTWRTHLPGDDPEKGDPTDPFHAHWSWKMGGSTTYMPTFNKNKDSLKADINGTWANRFGDYIPYEKGEKVTDFACYDDDDNDIEDENTVLVEETHTAKPTPAATVIKMQEWIENGRKLGNFWVYDEDGWAYWAQALAPGEVTGLLLDEIRYISADETPCYYGINVVGQFVTAGEWGSPTGGPEGKGDGFYAPDVGAPPTDEALLLLKLAAGLEYTVDLAPQTPEGGTQPEEGQPVPAKQGETLQFQATVTCAGTEISTQTVTWTLSGAAQEGTSISETGLLTVAADEPAGTVLTVTARSWTGAESSLEVTVTGPEGLAGDLELLAASSEPPEMSAEPTKEPETSVDPGPDPTKSPGSTPEPTPTPTRQPDPEPIPTPAPKPDTTPVAVPTATPKPAPEPEPDPEPEPTPAPEPLLPPDA